MNIELDMRGMLSIAQRLERQGISPQEQYSRTSIAKKEQQTPIAFLLTGLGEDMGSTKKAYHEERCAQHLKLSRCVISRLESKI
jgi:hypothetical protein